MSVSDKFKPSALSIHCGQDGHFEWTHDALIERCGNRTFIYGRWDRVFGCWQKLDDASRAFTPSWPLVTIAGLSAVGSAEITTIEDEWGEWLLNAFPFSPEDQVEHDTWMNDGFHGADLVRQNSDDARNLFDLYAALIPIETRRIAAAFGSWQWTILKVLREAPKFEDHLAKELRSVGPGFVAACMALAGADQLDRTALTALATSLMLRKRSQIISDLLGSCTSRMAVSWLTKLEADSCSKGRCLELLGLLTDRRMAQTISHMRRLTNDHIWWIARLPGWLCSARLVDCLAQGRGQDRLQMLEQLKTFCSVIERHHDNRKRDAADVLQRSLDWHQMSDTIGEQLERLRPFPPPHSQTPVICVR